MQTLNVPKKDSIDESNGEDAESDKMSVVSERSGAQSRMSAGSRKSKTARRRRRVIKPDKSIVYKVHENFGSFFESMYYNEENPNWEKVANKFVLSLENKNIRNFVDFSFKAKIEMERKMRIALNQRILTIRNDKMNSLCGKKFTPKIRAYIKMLIEEDEIAKADLLNNPRLLKLIKNRTLDTAVTHFKNKLFNVNKDKDGKDKQKESVISGNSAINSAIDQGKRNVSFISTMNMDEAFIQHAIDFA